MVAELVGAVLVLAEACILFAGVVSRYVFDSPIMWTDELANFLLLWLAMLGTVVALAPRRAHAADHARQLGRPRFGRAGSAPLPRWC